MHVNIKADRIRFECNVSGDGTGATQIAPRNVSELLQLLVLLCCWRARTRKYAVQELFNRSKEDKKDMSKKETVSKLFLRYMFHQTICVVWRLLSEDLLIHRISVLQVPTGRSDRIFRRGVFASKRTIVTPIKSGECLVKSDGIFETRKIYYVTLLLYI